MIEKGIRGAARVAMLGMIGLSLVSMGCQSEGPTPAADAPGADVIVLDSLAALGKPERPAVLFPHERHVSALGGSDSCRACHVSREERLDFSYIAESGLSFAAARNAWHQKCLGCHQASVKSGQPGGTLTCAGCHPKKAPAVPEPAIPAFYDRYHESHEYLEGGCGLCHHLYDEQRQELYYAPGAEEACWSCHENTQVGEVPSWKEAVHLSCVNCHLEVNNMPEGMPVPVNCAGCHGK